MTDSVLIFDIETKTFGRPDGNRDELKFFGCYSYKTKKYYLLTNKEDIRKALRSHKFHVGFNTKFYDELVLKRSGFGSELYQGVSIDLYEIIKKRASIINIKEGNFNNIIMHYSLDYITKKIGLVNKEEGKIKDFDYDILKKDTWTQEELDLINTYTERDIMVTKKLYEWVEDYFSDFKELVTQSDIDNKTYLTCSPASFAYKVVCKRMGWQEVYDFQTKESIPFEGGYVAYPAGEKFEGPILMFDFSSLYPNLFIMGNLFATDCKCCEFHEKWTGNNFFKIDGGTCKKELHTLSIVLKEIYLKRAELKDKKNPKEQTYKIIINGLYGAISNPKFTNIYNLVAAMNCTSLGRQFIKYVRKRFKEEGYLNIMTDTDSVAVQVPNNKTEKEAEELANKITEELVSNMPFPW